MLQIYDTNFASAKHANPASTRSTVPYSFDESDLNEASLNPFEGVDFTRYTPLLSAKTQPCSLEPGSPQDKSKLTPAMRQLMKPEQILAHVLADYQHVEIFQQRKTIGRPKKHIFSTHVKKDALWKPLFRKFRRFIKEYISQQVNLLDMEELSYEERAKVYCHILKVPSSLKSIPKTKHALVLIIESHRVTKRRKLIKFYEEIMGNDLNELKQKFLDFFFENSRQRRIEYFMDPLVRHLW